MQGTACWTCRAARWFHFERKLLQRSACGCEDYACSLMTKVLNGLAGHRPGAQPGPSSDSKSGGLGAYQSVRVAVKDLRATESSNHGSWSCSPVLEEPQEVRIGIAVERNASAADPQILGAVYSPCLDPQDPLALADPRKGDISHFTERVLASLNFQICYKLRVLRQDFSERLLGRESFLSAYAVRQRPSTCGSLGLRWR